MKLDYKPPLRETGLIQKRPLFHIILGCTAFICLILAISLRPSNKESGSTPYIEGNPSLASAGPEGAASKTSKTNPALDNSKVSSEKTGKTDSESSAKANLLNSVPAEASKDSIKTDKPEPTKVASNTNASNAPSSKKQLIELIVDDKPLASKGKDKDKDQAKQDQLKANWKIVKVQKGDTLGKIFKRQGYAQKDLDQLLALDKKISKKMSALQIQQTVKFSVDQNNHVKALALDVNGKTLQLGKAVPAVNLAKKDNDASKEKESAEAAAPLLTAKADDIKDKDIKDQANKEPTKEQAAADLAQKQIAFTKGTVKDSLYMAGKRAGLDQNAIAQLVDIFSWNIDFSLVQPTDTFRVLFEEKRIEGERVGTGPILAAEFVNKGKKHQAVRYTDKSGQTGYFSPDGFGLRETFSRYPLAFSHISSGFGKRNHPVYHKMRKHTGVDFAAPRGTPVKSTGDGKVVFVGTRGGYGRVIEIQHGPRYSTLYAHLSKFHKKLTTGKTVKKGEEIGYVGRSGVATGDHLHYEFRVDGVHRDPLTVALPKKNPIPDANKRHFIAHAKEMLRLMDKHENQVNMVRNEYPRNE